MGRDSYVASFTSISPETVADITRILIDSNAGRMPEGIEHGLVSLFSTLNVDGTRVAIGAPPATKDRDWSRVHMLTVDPAYTGRLRVLLGNLQQGIDAEPAYKNAFEKTPQQVDDQLNAYILAGKYETTPLSGRPLDARRQLYAKTPDPFTAELAQADVLLAHDAPKAREAYTALLNQKAGAPEPHEGLGNFDAAVKADSHNARTYLELGRITTDVAQKKAAFTKAAQLNPRWAEPLVLQAESETVPFRKAPLLKSATQLAPRNASYWRMLAEAQEASNQFADAGKSWGNAERATGSLAERELIRQARQQGEAHRLDQQAKERLEAKRKQGQDTQDMKNRALADIRAFEAKANQGQAPLDPNVKLGQYQEEKPTVLHGVLLRVECMGTQAKLYVQAEDRKTKQVIVRDPSKVSIRGGGEKALGCGVQKPARPLTIESLAGEVKSIDFH
jgi:tetratricopeptide (TPR) repeat protein